MITEDERHALLIFSGGGPLLVLSSYRTADDPRLVEQLRYKGIAQFLAYEVSLDAVRDRYLDAFQRVEAELAGREDVRVLDYNGHQIMANFSRSELGEPLRIGD